MADDDLDLFEEDENIDDTYLTFSLGEEVYAVGIAHVTEIVGLQEVIKVPDVPDFVKGVINLRGKIIPVIDVRLRFGMPVIDYTERTVIIVLDIKGVLSGLVVDSVNDVIEIPPQSVEAAIQFHVARSGRSVVRGMGRFEDRVCIILEVDALLEEGDIQLPTAGALPRVAAAGAAGASSPPPTGRGEVPGEDVNV